MDETLEKSFIILDEAQNTSHQQMKMFLTRMGIGSKIIITADPDQIDLSNSSASCLTQITTILTEIERIVFIKLTTKDVVRHTLVPKIIDAYKRFEQKNSSSQKLKP